MSCRNFSDAKNKEYNKRNITETVKSSAISNLRGKNFNGISTKKNTTDAS